MSGFVSLRDHLQRHAQHQADQIAFRYLTAAHDQAQGLSQNLNQNTGETLSFAELDQQARCLAQYLLKHYPPQSRVILLIPSGLSFVSALMACVYANMIAIPVPAYFQDVERLERRLPRLQAIAQNAQAQLVLCNAHSQAYFELIQIQAPDLAALHWLNSAEYLKTQNLLQHPPDTDWQAPLIQAQDLVFLQYSSGSTGQPKGVMVSHGNLMHNLAAIQRVLGHDSCSIGVSWLPAYHDLGLVADIFEPILSGRQEILISPFDFIRQPLIWLQAISDFRAHTSGAPNFAYALCSRKITPESLAQLDLSCWKQAYNCAEPVNAQVLKRFEADFAVTGFDPQAWQPFLGMAEATLMVSGSTTHRRPVMINLSRSALQQGRIEIAQPKPLLAPTSENETAQESVLKSEAVNAPHTRLLVSNGPGLPDQVMRIVDPQTCLPCPPDRVGELWLAGPSVAQGYWGQSELTHAQFQARIANETQGPGYLRTGDLGFIWQNELFLTGRYKDLLIIQGQNLYPQDLELLLEQAHPLIRPGCSAAFSLAADLEQTELNQLSEALILVAEVQTQHLDPAQARQIQAAIEAAIWAETNLKVADLVLIPPKQIPKTSSGKIQRRACQQAYLEQRFHPLWQARRPSNEVAFQAADDLLAIPPAWLQDLQILFAEVLNLSDSSSVAIDASFFELGGHSLDATLLRLRLQSEFDLRLSLAQVFEHPSIRQLAGLIRAQLDSRIANDLTDSSRQGRQQASPDVSFTDPILEQPIPSVDPEQDWPLSFAQERMYFLHQLNPDSDAYLMAYAFEIQGPMAAHELQAIQQSAKDLLQRHSALRTAFWLDENDQPRQKIHPLPASHDAFYVFADLSHLPAPDSEIRSQLQDFSRQSFDLSQPPLMRFALWRLSATQHVMAFQMHHLVSDGWSMGILYQEFSQLYQFYSQSNNRPATDALNLPALPIQLIDLAHWQRQIVNPEIWQADLPYWMNQLKGYPARPISDLAPSFQAGTIAASWSAQDAQKFQAWAQSHNLSLNMLLLGAFAGLLAATIGQYDLGIATPVAGRQRAELLPLVGLCVNTLILRQQIDLSQSFESYLQGLRTQVLAADLHQHLPFEQMVQAWRRAHPDTPHLSDVFFAFQHTPHGPLKLGARQIQAMNLVPEHTRFALDCQISMDPQQAMQVVLIYDQALFEASHMQAFLQDYQDLLQAICQTPAFDLQVWLQRRNRAQVPSMAVLHSQYDPRSGLNLYHLQDLWPGFQFKSSMHSLEAQTPEYTAEQAQPQPLEMRLDPPDYQTRTDQQISIFQQSDRAILSQSPTQALAYVQGPELIFPADAPLNVCEMLLRAESCTSKGLAWIEPSGSYHWQSYQQVMQKARCVLTGLRQAGLQTGQVLILQLGADLDHFACFLGAILGGLIPVNIALPAVYHRDQAVVQKLINTWKLLQYPHILCRQSDQSALQALLAESQDLAKPNTDSETKPEALDGSGQSYHNAEVTDLDRLLIQESLLGCPPTDQVYQAQAHDPVFYQLSSGSTGTPKCIAISHQGILAHCESAAQVNAYQPHEIWMNWIPLDHVVPMLTWLMQALYQQADLIHIATDRILAEPLRCLEYISQYRVNHAWSPNFALKLIADQLAQLAAMNDLEPKLDLSCLRSWMNAGEQVTPAVMTEFIQATQSLGFAESSMSPAFGMAEACTCMTYVRDFALSQCHYAPPGSDTEFVSTGPVSPGVEIRIVDAQQRILPESQIGRFQIRGAVITPGYVNNPEANQDAFVGEGWFNTGDLGFIYQRELYITGREKEMILVRGANIYCYEIEDLIGDLPGVKSAWVGVFALEEQQSGSEGFGLAFVPDAALPMPIEVVDPDLLQLIQTIQARITERLGLVPTLVLPLRRDEFPKTTSGKIQRSQIARQLSAGCFRQRVRAIDLALGLKSAAAPHALADTLPGRCLPDWFFETCWQAQALPLESSTITAPGDCDWLVDAVHAPFIDKLQSALADCTGRQIQILTPADWIQKRQQGNFAADSQTDLSSRRHQLIWLNPELPQAYTLDQEAIMLTQRFELVQAILTQPDLPLDWIEWAVTSDSDPAFPAIQGAIQGLIQSLGQERSQTAYFYLNTAGIKPEHSKQQTSASGQILPIDLSQAYAWLMAESQMQFDQARRVRYLPERESVSSGVSNARWQRQIQTLKSLRMTQDSLTQAAFPEAQIALVLGGQGAIAQEFLSILLATPRQAILVLGRRPLSDWSLTQQQQWQNMQELANKQHSYLEYLDLDLYQSDWQSLFQALAQLKTRFDWPFQTLIHAVGESFQECLLADITQQQWIQPWHHRAEMTRQIQFMVQQFAEPGALRVIELGSVNGYFGGFGVGAYATAQGYVDALASSYQAAGIPYLCLNQSIWPMRGLSQGKYNQGQHKGFLSIGSQAGRLSLQALLKQSAGVYSIGLNPYQPFIHTALSRAERLKLLAARSRGSQGLLASTQADDSACVLDPSRGQILDAETQQLSEIYAELLGLDRVSPQDDFFALGGHSLLAIQLLARIRSRMGHELALRYLFEAPRLADLAQIIRQQSASRLPLEDSATLNSPRITEPERQTPFWRRPPLLHQDRQQASYWPLSFAQERLWFIEQFEPENALYNTLFCLSLNGQLDRERLTQSLNLLLQRHEVFRMAFWASDTLPRSELLAPGLAVSAAVCLSIHSRDLNSTQLTIPYFDLRQAPEPEPCRQKLAQDLTRQPFDLSCPPLLRAQLLQLDTEQYQLQLVIHHLISDAWTMGLFFEALAKTYVELSSALEPEPEPEYQYLDYVLWQRHYLQESTLQAQLEYWRQTLLYHPDLLAFPTDYPRPALETYRGKLLTFELSSDLALQLEQLAQSQGMTLFMLLLAAFQVLLSRYSQQDDILVGIPVANRPLQELESMLGLFVNTLVIRGNLDGDPRFVDFARSIRQRCLEAYAHQDVPFEKLVEALNPPRSLSYHPLFQVMFVMQNASESQHLQDNLHLGAIQAELQRPGEGFAKFDLSLEMQVSGPPDAPRLQGRLEYKADLFEASTMQALIDHFENLLTALVQDPGRPVSDYVFLSPSEYQKIVSDWNQTRIDFDVNRCVHHGFEEQAAQAPERIALILEDRCLSYGELNQQANQLAHWLLAQGVQPESRIGVSMERSFEMIIGLLAILKVGACYVPLDPEYPDERIMYILQDTLHDQLAGWLLTQQSFAARFEELLMPCPLGVLFLDNVTKPWRDAPHHDPQVLIDPDQLISIIYTSGSTGLPKGVMNTHRGAYNHLVYRQSAFPMLTEDRIIQKTSLNFDGSLWEIFWTLMAGATLVISEPQGHKDSYYLSRFITRHRITMIDFVPSMLQVVLNEPEQHDFSSLRRVWVGGEGLSYALQQRFFERYPQISLIHGYGPTETTVSVTYWECSSNSDLHCVPIGRPNGNIQIYLLDRALNPVPVGVSGEIYIGGAGLARGYLNQESLTAEKFIANPFGPGRLYQSGDMARYLPNGAIEFIGRQDHQVKIRGFRVELGEIEAVLRPLVQDALVLMREDRPGQKRLVAYILASDPVSEDQQNQQRQYLHQELKLSLPDYMLPMAYVWLTQWPLDINGKIVRKALPEPSVQHLLQHSSSLESASAHVIMTVDEIRLADLYRQLLDLTPIGRDAHFFELGGHSLLATQLAARIREQFQLEMPLRQIFETPVLADLALAIQNAQSQNLPAMVPVTANASQTQWPLSFAQERLWFMDQYEPQRAFYNIPLALKLHGPLDIAALEASLRYLQTRHAGLRTCFVATTDSSRVKQQILPDLPFNWLIQDLRAAADPVLLAKQVALDDAARPFDLSQAPLWRVNLLKLAEDTHWLVMNLHHIIADGWSLKVLLTELQASYACFKQGQEPDLPPIDVQYADFAIWQREWFQGPVLQEQLRYWKRQLRDLPECLDLPLDHPRPAVQAYRGHRISFYYDLTLLQDLQAMAHQQGVTLFMLLLAAYQVLLHRLSQQEILAVGVPVANRRMRACEDLLGFFVNTLVVRGDLSANPSFTDLLSRVRHTCLEAYAHQDLPFEKLVEELNPQRDLSHHPLFQTLFVLQDASFGVPALDQVQTSSEELDSQSSRFDLALELIPESQGFKARVEYDADLFDESTIVRWIGHYRCLLQSLLANPDSPIQTLDLLDASERDTLLWQWNQNNRDFGSIRAVHQIFEAQVAACPQAAAVYFEGQTLSYAELNTRANQWAQSLMALSIPAQDPQRGLCIGVCLSRSIEWVVAMLAIFKIGAVYLPLDPAYPEQRLAYLIQDAQADLVLCDAASAQHLDRSVPQQNIANWQSQPDVTFDNLPLPDHWQANVEPPPAYMIYTSGSTGQPKGVLLSHWGLCNTAQAMSERFAVEAHSRVLQFASISFDASMIDIWMALSQGACLYIGSRTALQAGEPLAKFLQEHQVSHAILPPSVLALLPLKSDYHLKCLMVAGEACPLSLARSWAQYCRFFNGYGPTEATVCSHLGEFKPESNVLSIGPTLPNTQAYILDAQLNPVPIGVPGELYLAGLGLALGYWQRPELTRSHFIEHVFDSRCEQSAIRLYRTGDRVKYLPNGELVFLGRVDQQLKLRGFRIEPGEIEACLQAFPGIRQASVQARNITQTQALTLNSQEFTQSTAQLMAYLLADWTQILSAEQIEQCDLIQLEQWQQLYQGYELSTVQTPDLSSESQVSFLPGSNFSGWNSALSGQALPLPLMQAWRQATVTRILALKPQKIYEIGCGRGLLVSQIAPHIEQYWASDFSSVMLKDIEQLALPQVKSLQRRADQLSDLPDGFFDTFILNSVIQYFPSIGYLLQVLQDAWERLLPGGHIFVGDVRDLRLLSHLYTEKIYTRALMTHHRSASGLEWLQEILDLEQREEELCLSPAFFLGLKAHLPGLQTIDIQLKSGERHDELARYRYDVILHKQPDLASQRVDQKAESETEQETQQEIALKPDQLNVQAWSGLQRLDALESFLAQAMASEVSVWVIQGIPNARLALAGQLWQEVRALQTLDLHAIQVLDEQGDGQAVNPMAVWTLARQLGLEVSLIPAVEPDQFNVIFTNRQIPIQLSWEAWQILMPYQDLSSTHNMPLKQTYAQLVLPQLKQHVQQFLPEHLHPAHYLFLEQMPLNTSGKILVAALPVPKQSPTLDVVAPRNAIESKLAGLFEALLGLEAIGIHESFFDLGGHSLLAIQLLARIRSEFACDLALKTLFEAPTIARLAQVLQAQEPPKTPGWFPVRSHNSGMPALQLKPVQATLNKPQVQKLSYSQELWWMIYPHRHELEHGIQNSYAGLSLRGQVDPDALEQALRQIIARHEALRTRFMNIEKRPLRVIDDQILFHLLVIDCAGQSEADTTRQLEQLAQLPFNLEQGPLIRTVLFCLSATHSLLMVSVSHLVFDGWSLKNFLHELDLLYQAAINPESGAQERLPALPIQYSDYVYWHRKWVKQTVIRHQLLYWIRKGQNMPVVLDLPTDKPRSEALSLAGNSVSFQLSLMQLQSLQTLAQDSDCTLYMLMLAAFQSLLYRYSGQRDIFVGTPVANRPVKELDPVMGLFVNFIVLRSQISPALTFRSFLKQVRQTCLEAYAHQDLPFQILFKSFQAYKTLTALMRFKTQQTMRSNVMFNLLDDFGSDFQVGDLQAQLLPLENQFASQTLHLILLKSDKGIQGQLNYSEALFYRSTVETLCQDYTRLLERIVQQSDAQIDDLIGF